MALVSEIWKSMVLFPRSLFIGGFHHQQRKGQIWGRNLGGCISDSSLGVFRIRQVSFYMEDFTSSTTMSFISWPPPAHWVAPSTKTADDCCTWNCPPAYAALAPLPLPLPLLSPEPSLTLTRPLSLYDVGYGKRRNGWKALIWKIEVNFQHISSQSQFLSETHFWLTNYFTGINLSF